MIITQKKAMNIIASPHIVTKIPELYQLHERYKQKQAEVQRTKCSSCRSAQVLVDLGRQALDAIINLPSQKVQTLKEMLSTNEKIEVYLSDSSGVRLIQLG